MNNYFIAFFSDLNNNQISLINKYKKIKINDIRSPMRYISIDFGGLLTYSKYYILLNKYNKKSYRILNNIDTLCFLLYNNNFYKISYINKLRYSIKLKVDTKILSLNNHYKIKFVFNILKFLIIIKKKKCLH